MKRIAAYLFALAISLAAQAKVDLPSIFGDNMVLQQKCNAAIWGTAKADAKVTISVSWSKNKTITHSDADGKWKANIATPEAGGPYKICINEQDIPASPS